MLEGMGPRVPLQGLGAPLTSRVHQASSPLGPVPPQDWLPPGWELPLWTPCWTQAEPTWLAGTEAAGVLPEGDRQASCDPVMAGAQRVGPRGDV